MRTGQVVGRGRLPLHHLALQQPFIFASSDELHRLARHVPDGLSRFGIVSVEATRIICVVSRQGLVELDYFPFGYLASLAVSPGSRDLLDRAVKLLSDWSGRAMDPPISIDERDAASIIPARCASLLVAGYTRALNLNKSYMFELNNLRAEHEELQSSFLSAESLISSRNIHPVDLVFFNAKAEPGRSTATAAQFIRQMLPVASQGLSSIDVYATEPPGSDRVAFGFDCSLLSVESGTTLAAWSVQRDDVKEGWVNLRLPRALAQAAHTLALEFRPIGGLGHIPPLALGEGQPLRAFRVQASEVGTEELSSSLAMRCWSGLPGITPPEVGFVAQPEAQGARSPIHSLPLPPAFLAQVRRCRTDWHPEFDPVSFDERLCFVEVHPPSAGLMLARLPRLSLPTVCRIEAQAFVRNENASAVEFGLAFSDADEDEVLNSLSGAQHASAKLHFSGWVAADASRAALVMCAVPQADEGGHVYFATRMKDGAPNAFAWACYRNIRITSLSAGDAPSAGPAARAGLPRTRQVGRSELLRLAVEHGDPSSCRIVFPLQRPMVECHVFDSDIHIATLRNLDGDAAKIAVRVSSSPGYTGAADFGFGLFNGKLDRKLKLPDLEGPQGITAQVVFSGWNEILPAESAVFEIDVNDASGAPLSLVFAIRSKAQPVCITVSDLWLIGGEART